MGRGVAKKGRGRREPTLPTITKEGIFRNIQQAQDRSASLRAILEDYEATPVARRQIKDILTQLVKEGRLERHKGSRYAAPTRDLIEGTIVIHRDGYGFVVPSQKVPGLDSDVFIPPALTGSAMNGDKVQVEITLRKPGGRAEGRVVQVTKRARETVVGQLRYDGEVFFVAPTDEKLPAKIVITDENVSEHKDKMVEVEITRFPSARHWPAGRIVSVIGFLDDPDVETRVIIKKFGLPTAFPKEVEDEAAGLADQLTEHDFVGRDDFRPRKTVTIDPTTARDFDDAVDVEILKDGSFQLGVHIADVSHFVRADSAMDIEARCRGSSVYFPDRVIPMLPEKVSNHLCSLNARVDRLAFSVMMHVSKQGDVRDYSLHNSVIHSKERMNYDDVQKIIDGDARVSARYEHILPEIDKFEKLARILQSRRAQRGAIDFDLPEPVLTYNDQGDVTGIVKAVRHFSHRIVEEFMIVTNEVVARHLESREIPSLYRVHDQPDPDKAADFAEIVSGFGLKFRPKQLEPAEFQKFIASIAGRPEERVLSFLMLRSFKQAEYSAENIGHFGLASDAYTHFTSPIRRYPDLVVHRILKNGMMRKTAAVVPEAQLEAIAAESSERERIADQAERELFEWKKMILLERRLGDVLDGLIIAVWKDGFSVELIDMFVEGLVPAAELPGGWYEFDSDKRALISRRSKRQFRLGDRLKVRVVRIDKLLRRAYFSPVLAGGKRSR
jgi:ribonuclease R